MPIPEIHIPREATIVVAASNSKTPSADYVCSGANDHVEIQAALDALPATGGCIVLLDGTFTLGAQVVRAIDDVKFIGCGQATLLNLDGGTPVITAGGQDGWLFMDFATDAGGPAIGGATQSAIRNVWIAGARTDAPAPAPAAHEATHVKGGADDIDAALDARAVALANQGDIPYHAAAANTLAALAPGVAGQALLTGGAGANPSFGAPAPAAHAASHKDGAADELDVSELAGAIGGAGEIPETDGAAVTWVDPDARYDPKAHAASHEPAGGDPMTVDAVIGTGSLRTLGGGAQQAMPGDAAPAPGAHAASHKDGAADELDVSELAGALGSAGEIPESDGAAVSWVDPDGRYDPKAHETSHVKGGADDIDAALDARAVALANQGDIPYHAAAANTLAALAPGVAGQALLTGGAGANPAWGNVVDGAGAVGAVEAAGLTFDENKGFTLDPALSADGKWSGIVEAGTAGAILAFGDLVYLDGVAGNNKWELADADALATAFGKIGICVVAAAEDAATVILLWGKVRADTAFPALTIGAPVYISTTAGDIQVAAPAGSSDIIRIIGYGNTADELFFCPDNTYVEVT